MSCRGCICVNRMVRLNLAWNHFDGFKSGFDVSFDSTDDWWHVLMVFGLRC